MKHSALARFVIHCLATFLFISPLVMEVEATTYYVDSTGGNDGNSGTATNAAWQSLTKVNETTFQPGDNLLFNTGGSWIGTLSPQGSGATNNPIIISSYGTNSAMPLINGNGNVAAVAMTNQPYWEIDNLEVINPGASGTDTERYGIYLCGNDFGTINHLYVSNCFVHNICGSVDTGNGDAVAKRTGGITIETLDDTTTATRFNDIIIENCTISSVTNQGIVACDNVPGGGSDYPGTLAWTNRHCSNLIIRNNVINDVCKNAMSIRYGDNTCLVEHNVVFNTAIATSGNQIATYGCQGTVFQYNEGYKNNGGNAARDGMLYDSDLDCLQTVWQYSYSHDEFFGLFLNYSADGNSTSIVVRYNISRNDKGAIFAMSGNTATTASDYIYNNTIYTGAGLSPVYLDDRQGGPHTTYIYNNIFYNLGSPTYTFNTGVTTYHYTNNVFYNAPGSTTPANQPTGNGALTSDPKLVAPGTGTNGINTLTGYELQSNSPCISNPGVIITTNFTGNNNVGGLDFFGNTVPANQAPDRGANQFTASGSSSNAPVVTGESASSVTASNATLNASVNPGGLTTTYYFQYGITTNYGSFTSTNTLAAGANSIAVSNSISGLLPGTLYHYQAVANNSAGTGSGADATFTTPGIAPVVSTQPATSVTLSGATLNATVNPGGVTTTCYFQFGTTTNYGSFSTTNSIAAGTNNVAVSNAVSGLLPNTLYHYQAVANNSAGTGTGGDATFTTAVAAPVVTGQSANSVTASNATLNASVNPGGAATTYYFEYGTTTNYGTDTSTNTLAAGTSSVATNTAISGLLPGTLYHYQAVASNSAGTGGGGDATFTTASLTPPFIASGNLYVYQIGDGKIALTASGAAVFIDQFSNNGTLLNQVALPTNGASALVASGNTATEGSLALNSAGNVLTFMGYKTNLNTTFPSMNGRPTAGNNRDIGTVNASGVFAITVTNATAFAPATTGTGRGAVTDGNGNYWAAGVGSTVGVVYYGTNSAAAQVTTTDSARSIGIYGGTLYYSAGTNIFSVSATNSAATPTTMIIDKGGTTEGFIFNTNLTVCYIAEGNATPGGIRRYNLVGGNWTNSYTFSNGVPFGFVTADFSGANPVIYATTLAVSGGGNKLDKFTDAGSASGATLLATAPANENFNGIVFDSSAAVQPALRFHPLTTSPAPGRLQLASQSASLKLINRGSFTFSLINTSGLNFKVYSTTNVALAFSNWTLLGSMTESPAGSGQYQFTDTQATNGAEFYRVVNGP